WAVGHHPAFHVALWRNAHRQRARWYVFSDDRARSCVDAVINRNRCDEHIFRANTDRVTNNGLVFLDTVIVGNNRARTDVASLTDLGVADVAEMWHLTAVTNFCVLRLNKGTDLAVGAKLSAGPDI